MYIIVYQEHEIFETEVAAIKAAKNIMLKSNFERFRIAKLIKNVTINPTVEVTDYPR